MSRCGNCSGSSGGDGSCNCVITGDSVSGSGTEGDPYVIAGPGGQYYDTLIYNPDDPDPAPNVYTTQSALQAAILATPFGALRFVGNMKPETLTQPIDLNGADFTSFNQLHGQAIWRFADGAYATRPGPHLADGVSLHMVANATIPAYTMEPGDQIELRRCETMGSNTCACIALNADSDLNVLSYVEGSTTIRRSDLGDMSGDYAAVEVTNSGANYIISVGGAGKIVADTVKSSEFVILINSADGTIEPQAGLTGGTFPILSSDLGRMGGNLILSNRTVSADDAVTATDQVIGCDTDTAAAPIAIDLTLLTELGRSLILDNLGTVFNVTAGAAVIGPGLSATLYVAPEGIRVRN